MAATTLQRVLCVEDEPDIRALAGFSLGTVGGLEVRVCSSGEEALDMVVEFAPDLVLLDVTLPKMDGPAVLKELRKLPETAATPVVFFTARAREAEIDRYRQMGAADVILKPFNPMTLAQQLRVVWERIHA